MEKLFVRVIHWVMQVDELGIGDPGINNLELREGRIARVNGAGVQFWAQEILRNSVTAGRIVFEGILTDGQRVQVSGSITPEHFALRLERGGKESRFVALAGISSGLARVRVSER
jgi:hypothetical protein